MNIQNHYSNVSLGNQRFSFSSVELHDVEKKLRTFEVRKSPGYDNIPAKLIKFACYMYYSNIPV